MADAEQQVDLEHPDVQNAINERVEAEKVGLIAKRDELLAKNRQLNDLKQSLGDDFDLEEYRKLRQAAAETREKDLKKQGDWEAMKEALTEEHGKAIQAERSRAQGFETSMNKLLIDERLTHALSTARVSAEGLDLLPERLKGFCKAEQTDDGAYVVRVYDENDRPRVNSDGTYQSIDDLVSWAAEKWPNQFNGSGVSGAGSPPVTGATNGAQITPDQAAGLSMAEYRAARAAGRL